MCSWSITRFGQSAADAAVETCARPRAKRMLKVSCHTELNLAELQWKTDEEDR